MEVKEAWGRKGGTCTSWATFDTADKSCPALQNSSFPRLSKAVSMVINYQAKYSVKRLLPNSKPKQPIQNFHLDLHTLQTSQIQCAQCLISHMHIHTCSYLSISILPILVSDTTVSPRNHPCNFSPHPDIHQQIWLIPLPKYTSDLLTSLHPHYYCYLQNTRKSC